MSSILYRPGKGSVVNGIECESITIDTFDVAAHFQAGWCSTVEEFTSESETIPEIKYEEEKNIRLYKKSVGQHRDAWSTKVVPSNDLDHYLKDGWRKDKPPNAEVHAAPDDIQLEEQPKGATPDPQLKELAERISATKVSLANEKIRTLMVSWDHALCDFKENGVDKVHAPKAGLSAAMDALYSIKDILKECDGGSETSLSDEEMKMAGYALNPITGAFEKKPQD